MGLVLDEALVSGLLLTLNIAVNLPVVRVDMSRSKVNSLRLGVANEIRPKKCSPLPRVHGELLRIFRSIEAFKPHSEQMVLVN